MSESEVANFTYLSDLAEKQWNFPLEVHRSNFYFYLRFKFLGKNEIRNNRYLFNKIYFYCLKKKKNVAKCRYLIWDQEPREPKIRFSRFLLTSQKLVQILWRHTFSLYSEGVVFQWPQKERAEQQRIEILLSFQHLLFPATTTEWKTFRKGKALCGEFQIRLYFGIVYIRRCGTERWR